MSQADFLNSTAFPTLANDIAEVLQPITNAFDDIADVAALFECRRADLHVVTNMDQSGALPDCRTIFRSVAPNLSNNNIRKWLAFGCVIGLEHAGPAHIDSLQLERSVLRRSAGGSR
jgi:hypothetical protein